MHDRSLFKVKVFATEDMPLSDLKSYIQMSYIMHYTHKLVPHPF